MKKLTFLIYYFFEWTFFEKIITCIECRTAVSKRVFVWSKVSEWVSERKKEAEIIIKKSIKKHKKRWISIDKYWHLIFLFAVPFLQSIYGISKFTPEFLVCLDDCHTPSHNQHIISNTSINLLIFAKIYLFFFPIHRQLVIA